MDFLIESIANVSWQNVVMWAVGALLIFLKASPMCRGRT